MHLGTTSLMIVVSPLYRQGGYAVRSLRAFLKSENYPQSRNELLFITEDVMVMRGHR